MVTPLGNDGHMVIVEASREISGNMASPMEVVVVDPKWVKTSPDGA
jgi:hypothetical protein